MQRESKRFVSGPTGLLLAGGVTMMLWLTGCATTTPPAATPPAAAGITPGPIPEEVGGSVVQVRAQWGFAVIDFRGQPVPAGGAQFGVYRQGTKVGVVQVSEPVRTRFAAADILQGELRVGDAVR